MHDLCEAIIEMFKNNFSTLTVADDRLFTERRRQQMESYSRNVTHDNSTSSDKEDCCDVYLSSC